MGDSEPRMNFSNLNPVASEHPTLYHENNLSVDSLTSTNGGMNPQKGLTDVPVNELPSVHMAIQKSFDEFPLDGYKIIEEGEIRWEIPSWSEFRKSTREQSMPLSCGGYNWRILVFPNGNNNNFLSIYLQLDMPIEPEDSEVCADFVLATINSENEKIFVHQYSSHRFSKIETDWGFTQFHPLVSLSNSASPILMNDRMTLLAKIRVIHDETGVLFHTFRDYDSKKTTGFVGLKNQGATCYMNSLLQSLYCTNYFRKAVYQIPLPKEKETSVTLSLQRLFYFMQTSAVAVETNELTNSFGWNTVDAFAQHDVQEFLRVLTDNLEEKMKGTPADGMIQSMFVGKMKSYIQCIDVDYESSRVEDFYDIQLNVKGMKNVLESFHDYIQVEKLEGENKYMAEGHGLQDAKKGVLFEKFPPVLHLQLKRFEYDFNQDRMIKINDRYEFPLVLDLDEYLSAPEDAAEEDRGPQRYHLHGVLVHAGNVDGGHYCAFIRPTLNQKWFKFDDDRVLPVTLSDVLEDNFGGDYGKLPIKFSKVALHRRFTNAYMLVYIRETDYDRILCPVTEEDVPLEIRAQLEREKRDHLEKEMEDREKSNTVKVRVIHDELLKQHPVYFDLWDFSTHHGNGAEWCRRFYKKDTKWRDVVAVIAEEWKVFPGQLRFWFFDNRSNKTYRLSSLGYIPEENNAFSLEELRHKFHPTSPAYEFHLYCEISHEPLENGTPPSGPCGWFPDQLVNHEVDTKSKQVYVLLFVKVFDVEKQKLWVAGHVYVPCQTLLKELGTKFCELAGWPFSTPFAIWEEVHMDRWEPMDMTLCLRDLDLHSGDILTIQRTDTLADLDPMDAMLHDGCFCKTAAEYYDYLQNRVEVHFKPRSRDQAFQHTCTLKLSKRHRYDEVCERLAHHLNLSDPLKLRFTGVHSNELPKPYPIKRQPDHTLKDILVHSAPTLTTASPVLNSNTASYAAHPHQIPPNVSAPGVLLYEVLDIPITEIDSKRKFPITVLVPGKEESMEVFVDKQSTMSTLSHLIQEKLKGSASPSPATSTASPRQGNLAAAPLVLYELTAHRIGNIFTGNEQAQTIPEYQDIVGQILPADLLNMFSEGTPLEENQQALHQDQEQPSQDEEAKGPHIIRCTHFDRHPNALHGIPFRFPVHATWTVAELKRHLQKYLGYSDKEAHKLHLVLLPIGAVEEQHLIPLQDSDIFLKQLKLNPSSELGLNHPPRRVVSQYSNFEKGIRIFN